MDNRTRIANWIESRNIQFFITGVIIINAITLGMETSPAVMEQMGGFLHLLDKVALSIFVIEILLKLYGRGFGFFKDGWNLFDFIVVAIAIIPASGPLAVLRSFRILRVLRLMSMVPQMRSVIQALITAIPGMFSIIGLITLIFYVSAVLSTNFYAATFNEWFGDIGASMYTLFQVMTLESWSMGIVRPIMDVHPEAWMFFVPFILVTSFAVINLFIGVIVDAMQGQHQAEAKEIEETVHEDTQSLREEIAGLRGEIGELKELLKNK
ncbi:Ion transport protein [Candidatus Terasakiella magnetica]|uniref:Ion transport protein n=1 Tax=Candidatus Terasakiella magnetica TaxID=1867952 RepID=A0A1C3RDG2_9PROT|nr:ion transporter [Candidatus Terasakiella magnetica]SCA55271.1 Ion transport protein [Candidatus Terasakiella magnetica]